LCVSSRVSSRHLFTAQRRALVLDYLRGAGASVPQLCEALLASPATIRRDLDYLSSEGYLDRSHGGAVAKPLLGTTFEADSTLEPEIAHDAKVRIGGAAAQLVQPRQSVIFDSSSTVLEAARCVAAADIELTAVTNYLRVAMAFAQARRVRTVLLGGMLRRGSGHHERRARHRLPGPPSRRPDAVLGIHTVSQLPKPRSRSPP